MAQITAAQVKTLRERTGAGMMDCKRALGETDGDMESAVDLLRTKGLAAAAKKASRVASDGLVGIANEALRAAVVEVNTETDFVARNEQFQEAVRSIAGLALGTGDDIEALSAATYPGSASSVADKVTELVGTIGENIQLRRAASLAVNEGVVASYMHGVTAPNLGRIGVLVALESAGDSEKLSALGRQIAMHIAHARPEAVSTEDVATATIERERNIFAEQARESGKPENIVEKMVEGRLRKFFEEIVLLEQAFVLDTDRKLAKVLEDAAGDIGAPVSVTGFVRFALGEGIEKESTDFVAEVAAQLAT